MTVSQKYHKKIVYILSGVLIFLFILLGFILFKPDVFGDWGISLMKENLNKFAPRYFQAQTVNPFLREEQVVIIRAPGNNLSEDIILPITKTLFEYVEVTDGCGIHFDGECLNVRSGPGEEYPVVNRLRNTIVLKVGGKVERDGQTWYKIVFDEWLRYPERVEGDWYVSANHVRILLDEGIKTIEDGEHAAIATKKIIVNRTTQTIYAYEDENLFMEEKISTGLELSPTPRGEFIIFRKTPSRYMQGPIPGIAGSDYYDLPGVPWNLYFTHGGAVIHGAYWHNSFGKEYSHGCVNLPPQTARKLYNWADIGTHVIVTD
ncbi:hypothetical protein A3I18_00100 [Candidatus Campbellbacteria bacterium RIFCSPLOWO2_02_FULL_35_11]|uniref:L,D-TPase catalytic domain-containing protein n=2 Tax=Candidatus Campbelliibacteriota TaxID=1752727 RepID=A0A1F5EL83_9BACT|nr:MAG: hypothetical protein A3E89_01020 [Candidatus Campbellbacteria bacterium RIFCSPHIGHO2_12_FULL_35_10]OGD70041.1 MAG: hypothetical protein A3I18_00100 [Candidatus Campbellbacteria bacterium RIFCSPLOWO2_02_FULL_35_11]